MYQDYFVAYDKLRDAAREFIPSTSTNREPLTFTVFTRFQNCGHPALKSTKSQIELL